MVALLCFLLTLLVSPFKSKSRLEAENAVLRHQLTVLQRKLCGTAIAYSSSSCTVGFRRCSRPCRSSGPRPSCAGTEPGCGDIGAGNPAPLVADRESMRTYAR